MVGSYKGPEPGFKHSDYWIGIWGLGLQGIQTLPICKKASCFQDVPSLLCGCTIFYEGLLALCEGLAKAKKEALDTCGCLLRSLLPRTVLGQRGMLGQIANGDPCAEGGFNFFRSHKSVCPAICNQWNSARRLEDWS